MISSLIEWPHRSTCHHPSRHNRGEATGTWIPRQIEDIPSIISIQSASNSLIALTSQVCVAMASETWSSVPWLNPPIRWQRSSTFIITNQDLLVFEFMDALLRGETVSGVIWGK